MTSENTEIAGQHDFPRHFFAGYSNLVLIGQEVCNEEEAAIEKGKIHRDQWKEMTHLLLLVSNKFSVRCSSNNVLTICQEILSDSQTFQRNDRARIQSIQWWKLLVLVD